MVISLENKKMRCSSCYFSSKMGRRWHCVKNAPDVNKRTGEARWPVVKASNICGKFCFVEDHVDKDQFGLGRLPNYSDEFGEYCRIPLSNGDFAKVDPKYYAWLSQWQWHCRKHPSVSYAVRKVRKNGKTTTIIMHRIIMDTPSHLVCDHINGNGLDNRRKNLRNCTRAQNNINRSGYRKSSSKFKGVCFRKSSGKYAASIRANGKQIYLGYFTNEIDAAKAYDTAAKKYQKEFARLNFA